MTAASGAQKLPGSEGRGKTMVLALVASAGMHLIFLMTMDGSSPGPWRHGLQPALQVSFAEPAPNPALPSEVSMTRPSQPPKDATATPGTGQRASESSVGATFPGELRYYRANEVDVPPAPLNRPHLVIPEIAYVSRLAGAIRARVYIGEQGVVERIEIIKAEPRAGIFEQAALEALQQLRYTPAELSGRAVRSVKTIEVVFDSRDDEANP
jgi:TonB family protein